MDLIADLLDVSRVISGITRLEIGDLDLADVVTAAIEAIRPTAEAKGVRIERLVSHFAGPVRGDAGRLQQVLWNLLSNAVKFTPKGGRVQIVLAKRGSVAEITVSDTGMGIIPEFLPHVFERFRQADASTTRTFGGLGLGLAIVKHLIELHGGSARAESEGAGKGATFIVELPIAITHRSRTETDPPGEFSQATVPCAVADVDLTGIRVLAVDDQADSIVIIRRVLEDCHAQVIGAGSAEEALAALEAERPDVILCDIGMPAKDGYSFLKELRESGDDTPAIAVTAFARPEDKVRSLRAGYHAHVSKPIDTAELVSTVAVFSRRHPNRGGRKLKHGKHDAGNKSSPSVRG
jgi:CheY-like chemotaxis protein